MHYITLAMQLGKMEMDTVSESREAVQETVPYDKEEGGRTFGCNLLTQVVPMSVAEPYEL